jgi:hypothetical protein
MHEVPTTTGIPIEYLFGLIGILISIIYCDIKRELRKLRTASELRDLAQERFRVALIFICRKLDIPFSDVLQSHHKDDSNES